MTVSGETLRSISAPDQLDSRLGKLDFVDGVPSPGTSELVYDHLDFVHGLNAYLNGFPGASTWAAAKRLPRGGSAGQRDPDLLGADGFAVAVPDRERRHGLLRRHRRSHLGTDGRRDASAGARAVRRHVVSVDRRLRPPGPGSRRRRPFPARPTGLRRLPARQRLPRRPLAHDEGDPARPVVHQREPGPGPRSDRRA